MAGRVEEEKRPSAQLEGEALRRLHHPRRLDGDEPAVVSGHRFFPVHRRGAGPQLRRVDHVARPARVDDEAGPGQPPHHLPRPARVVEVDVGHDHVVHGLGPQALRLEDGQQAGRRVGRAHVHEGRPAALHDEVARVEERAHVAGVDGGDPVAEVFEYRSAHAPHSAPGSPGRPRRAGAHCAPGATCSTMAAVAETTSHSWTCPTCGRRVPLRAEACHCGMPRARAEELAAAAAPAERRPPRPTRQVSPGRLFAALPRDVKALVVGGALVLLAWPGVDGVRARAAHPRPRPCWAGSTRARPRCRSPRPRPGRRSSSPGGSEDGLTHRRTGSGAVPTARTPVSGRDPGGSPRRAARKARPTSGSKGMLGAVSCRVVKVADMSPVPCGTDGAIACTSS